MCVTRTTGARGPGNRTPCDCTRWLHLPWTVICVGLGSLQIVAGVFYLMSLPVFRLGSNLYAGCWNVLGGIIGGMLVCAGPSGRRRHELILYLAVATCAVNLANLLILELGELKNFFPETTRKVLEEDGFDETPVYMARLTTSLTAAVSALAAFLESQFAFCAMHCCAGAYAGNKRGKGQGGKADGTDLLSRNNDQGTDTEYIITRPKPDSIRKSPNNINNVSYAQSWVFESDGGGGMCQGGHDDTSPSLSAAPTDRSSGGPSTPMQHTTAGINGTLVSFSRAATPSPRGGRSPAVIYATRQQISQQHIQHVMQSPPASYAAKTTQPSSGNIHLVQSDSSADSKSSARDAEFSRELEAALQLIQELETPSEDHPVDGMGKQNSGSPTDSEKTLSAGGKHRYCDSQSTSGYSSPSRRGYSIRASDAATVISLHGTRPRRNASRCITLLNVDSCGAMTLLPVSSSSSSSSKGTSDPTPRSSDASSSTETLRAVGQAQPWTTNVRSLLRSRKQTGGPKLPPELEAAIIKSESLAYLTDVELMQRHERNREIQRKIQQRVQKQLSNGTLPHSHQTDSSTVISNGIAETIH